MFRKKLFRCALPVILSVAMVLQSVPATVLAAEGNTPQVVEQITEEGSEPERASDEESSEPESAYETVSEEGSKPESASSEESSEPEDSFSMNLPDEIPFEIKATDIFAGLNQSDMDLNAVDVNAAVYDPRVTAPETLTAVKDQYPYGTCWAFATTAIMENSMTRQRLADNSIDLSERHLAYFAYNTGSDRLGNAVGDTIVSSPADTYLNRGGNTFMAAIKLMNWHGMALESDYPYSNVEGTLPERLSENDAQNVAALAHDFYFIPTDEATTEQKKSVVKELISKYGCVAWSYAHIFSDIYYNSATAAYYYPGSGTNHEITVVGWDDNFSKDNFATTPEGDGAWIVKNSWSTDWGGMEVISTFPIMMGHWEVAILQLLRKYVTRISMTITIFMGIQYLLTIA